MIAKNPLLITTKIQLESEAAAKSSGQFVSFLIITPI